MRRPDNECGVPTDEILSFAQNDIMMAQLHLDEA